MKTYASERIAIFPGSFNPPSLGHLDIIKRSASLFDEIIVAVGTNPSKSSSEGFSSDERVNLLKSVTSAYSNVKTQTFQGLLKDYAKTQKCKIIIRGLRNACNFEHENGMAIENRRAGNLETLFLIANPLYQHITSSLIREIAYFGSSLEGLVPAEIEVPVLDKFRRIES